MPPGREDSRSYQRSWGGVEVFEYAMDKQDPIERIVIPGEALLAIGDDNQTHLPAAGFEPPSCSDASGDILTAPIRTEDVSPVPAPSLPSSGELCEAEQAKSMIEATHPSGP